MKPQNTGLILATQSRYKRELLARLGVAFEADAAHIDESRLPGEAPMAMASRLAEAKARAVALRHPEAYVLGADQVVFKDDQVFGKPHTAENAVEQLLTLQGGPHTLLSAIALVCPDGSVVHAHATTLMEMRPLSREALELYVTEDQPLDCAGAYKVEERGIRLFYRMHGDDYTNIIGLPLTRVVDLLQERGLL